MGYLIGQKHLLPIENCFECRYCGISYLGCWVHNFCIFSCVRFDASESMLCRICRVLNGVEEIMSVGSELVYDKSQFFR